MMSKIPFLYDYVMANIVLPNALKPELAVINYYHSLHSNKLRAKNLFDGQDTLKNDTAMTFIFDNSLGSWATSNSGTNFSNPCFKSYFDYFEDSLHFGKRNFAKYVYPIQVTPHFEQFTGFYDNGSKLNGEFFWKHMSKEALTDVRKGRALIILDYLQENTISKKSLEKLHEAIEIGGLPKNSVIFVFNSFNAEDIYKSWFAEEDRWLEMKTLPFVTTAISSHYKLNLGRYIDDLTFASLKNKLRKHKFIFQTRRARGHRLALLCELFQQNLLREADWSFLEMPTMFPVKQIENEYNFKIESKTVDELRLLLPKSLESEPAANSGNVTGWDIHPDAFKNSYFNLCTESIVTNDFQSVTEKVYKPIINFQPFIFFAAPGSLALLQKIGFKTFSPWINEDYDSEPDLKLRSSMIVKEVQRLCAMTHEELHHWYWQMEEILIHNRNHLLNFHVDNDMNKDFFKYLFERLK